MVLDLTLATMRNIAGLTQQEFAHRMGVPFRTYQDLEANVSKTRPVHIKAAERAMLKLASETGNPMLAPKQIRNEALRLAGMLAGTEEIIKD